MVHVTVARQAVFAAAFTAAIACGGYDSTSPNYPPVPSSEDGLWTASAFNPAIFRLAPSQLLTDGTPTPATSISTTSADLFNMNGIAFDTDGTMWVTSQDDSTLVGFAPAALAKSGSTPATIVISSTAGSLSGPTSLAFDPQHRLWVSNSANGTIVRFDRAQLATSGAPVPAVTIAGLGLPTGLAFDNAGSLWVADTRRRKIASFTPAQQAVSGFIAPSVVISAVATSIVNPTGLAFDASGNLWFTNPDSRSVASFTQAQLAATGSPAPSVVVSSDGASLSVPVGLAFDAGGSLWVINAAGQLEKFATASLGATGAPAPSVRLKINDGTLFWSLAFWPKPAGLPVN